MKRSTPSAQIVCIFFNLFVCIIASHVSNAQDLAPEQNKFTVIKAKGLIDVRNGRLIEQAVIHILNGKIERAGSNLEIPVGATVINLSDKYLLPGLIDAHTHLCHEYQYELEKVPGANIVVETAVIDNATRALIGVRNARDMINSGYTTVRDLGNSGVNADIALRDAINKNWIPGPRVFASTRAISPIGGQFTRMPDDVRRELVQREYVEISGVEEARRAVKEAIYDGADCIKIIVNNDRMCLNQEELNAIVEEAHKANLKVAAHATNGDGPSLMAIKAGVNSIEHGYTLSSDVLKLMAAQGVYLVPTDRTGVERYQQRIKRALAANVKIAFGSDMYFLDAQRNRGQVTVSTYRSYIEAGMNNIQILQSATMNPGILIAGEGKVGLLEKGYFADIIALDKNPLTNIEAIENVVFVMKEGKVIFVDRSTNYSK
ncbi:amidohydrolase family protein [Chitinophaga pinensis]|uniref:Amidohydrolase n=1 Tax=Chitinophaga pinensis (strain ATCC 43595 / DSM 2588 / LMG 13176 / NBRC 15968 / NCIMB 11800 / UQM 2034) TaxID=485918 RepID=A0A979GUH4_CHIPD|nr:amidohydrolase family protein [Chitinophaga pinensis]ACU60411.1 amidohydrolase [Chitinophaga pinensis DSM 2588]